MRLLSRKQDTNSDVMESKTIQAKAVAGPRLSGSRVRHHRKTRSLSRSRTESSKSTSSFPEQRDEITVEEREPSDGHQIKEIVTIPAIRDDMDLTGFAPLDPMADDDDSIVLTSMDRYAAVESRDVTPKEKSLPPKKIEKKVPSKEKQARSKKSSPKKTSEEQESKLMTSESMDTMSVSVSMASAKGDGCIGFLDSIMMCLDSNDNLERTYTQEESVESASFAGSVADSSDEEDSCES